MKGARFFLFCGFIFMLLYIGNRLVSAQTLGVAKIAFSSNRNGNWEIYLMNPNGSGQINLTHHPRSDLMPTFSPTGAQILFVSTRDEGRDLYLMDPNGANVRRVFKEKAWRQSPAWSPDGRWIAYQKGNSNDAELYIASMDDRVEHRIAWVGHADADPSWSPDGTEIVFVVNVPFIRGIGPLSNTKLVFIDVQTRVEEAFLPEEPLPLMETPAWSPVGDVIAFSWGKLGLGQRSALFIADRNGREVKRILAPVGDDAVVEMNPVWSPDGSELIYEYGVLLDRELFKTDLQGGDPERLTQQGVNKDADWFDPAFALPVQPQAELLTTLWGQLKQREQK